MGGLQPVRVGNATGLFQIGGAHWVDSARPSGFSSFRRAAIGAIVALNSSVTPRPVTAESMSGGARFAPCASAGPCARIARFVEQHHVPNVTCCGGSTAPSRLN
jgi:hypothetical protein